MQRRTILAAPLLALARQAHAETPVTIAIQYGIGYLPVMIAEKLGLFTQRTSIPLILARMSGATAVNDALISGSIDVGAYGLPGMLIARERTLRNYGVRGLASLSSLPYGLYTNQPRIRTLEDIGPDDRIAVTAPNTPQAELLRMAAEKTFNDAHRLDTRMVSLPHPDATIALISGTTITLYFATPPFSTTLDSQPGIHRVTSSKDILGEEITGGMLATTTRFPQRPNAGVTGGTLAAALVAALTEANTLIQTDPARAAALYLQSEPSKLTAPELESLLRQTAPLFNVAPTGTMAMAAFMLKQSELHTPLSRWQDAFFPPVNEGPGS